MRWILKAEVLRSCLIILRLCPGSAAVNCRGRVRALLGHIHVAHDVHRASGGWRSSCARSGSAETRQQLAQIEVSRACFGSANFVVVDVVVDNVLRVDL